MTYIITGAAGGLGQALAKCLSKQGERLLLVGRNEEKLKTLLAELNDANHKLFVADLTKASDVQALKEYVVENWGVPDGLINCAGHGVFGRLPNINESDIAASLETNLLSVIYPCRAFVEIMQVKGGVIANVMSTAAQKGKANETVYCAAKWGVRGFTEALREEVKSTKVRVIGVYPAGMNTGFWQQTSVDYPLESFMTAEQVAELIVPALESCAQGYVSDIVLSR
ncbi:SDR family oxidoreductase [Parashewanella curva]|uniref:SDR family oxidoreductase n=1 Tax=Parashewanella curva TaxID=2338552 RepID=A0A3L8PX92_9GAMM|nr:SDR family oxidoreductase [Parashewanella curva]RLV59419.1 SDR family oxidoreductase [Parashewanella curva]